MQTVNSVTQAQSTRIRALLAGAVGLVGLATLAAHPALADRAQVYAGGMAALAISCAWSAWWAYRHGLLALPADRLPPTRGVQLAAAALLASALLSVLRNPGASLLSLWLLVAQLLLATIGCLVADSGRARRRLGAAFAAGVVATSTYAVVQFVGWDPLPAATPFAVQRVVGPFANPNDLGNLLACAMPVAMGMLFAAAGMAEQATGRRGAGGAGGAAALLVLAYLGLLLSASRGAWMAALAGGGLVLAGHALDVRRRHSRWPWRWLLGSGVTMVVLTVLVERQPVVREPNRLVTLSQRARSTGLILEPLVRERATPGPGRVPAPMAHDTAINHRYFIWQVTLQMIRARPIAGVGYGEYGRRFGQFRDALRDRDLFRTLNEVAQTEATPYAHNEYLHAWAECGLPGLVSLLALLGLGVVQSLRDTWASPRSQPLRWGLLGLVAAMLTHSLVSYPLHLQTNGLVFWTAFGVLLSRGRTAPVRR